MLLLSCHNIFVNCQKFIFWYLFSLNNWLHILIQVETRTLEEVKEVLEYAVDNKTSLTRIMLDNMVVPLSNGDVDVSMLKDAVQLISGRFETEVNYFLNGIFLLFVCHFGISYSEKSSIVGIWKCHTRHSKENWRNWSYLYFKVIFVICFLFARYFMVNSIFQLNPSFPSFFKFSGALTHSVKALDISLKIDTELALKVGRRTNRA